MDELVKEISYIRIYKNKAGRKRKTFDIELAKSIRARVPQPGWRAIAKEMSCGVSYQTVRRRILHG
jgi:predicted DNA binding CopG/RHH family protein